MSSRPADTDAETLEVLFELYRRMTPTDKLQRVRELTLAANRLALAGLRRRHPGDSGEELLLRLARVRLGDEVVDRVYGSTGDDGVP